MLSAVNQKIRSDILLAYYVCKYNLSFNFSEKLPFVIRNIAFDSEIVKKFNPNRK